MPPPLSLLVDLLPRTGASLLYALGYGTGVGAFALMARRRGLSTPGVWSLVVVGLLGGLLGANLAQYLATGAPGKSVLGGVTGGYLSVFLYKRYIGLRRPTGDLFAVGMMAGEAVGRWGCFLGGCCFGRPVAAGSAAWCVEAQGACRYPAQIYLSLVCAAILAVLVAVEARRALPENGLFFLQGALYAAARFVIEFYRTADPVGLGLTVAQWTCLVAVAFFGTGLWRLVARERVRVAAPEAVPAPAMAAEAGG